MAVIWKGLRDGNGTVLLKGQAQHDTRPLGRRWPWASPLGHQPDAIGTGPESFPWATDARFCALRPFTPLPAAAAVQPLHISRGPPPRVCLSRLTRCSWLHSYNGALVPALLRHRRWLPGAHRMPPSAFARHRAHPRRTPVYLHGLALGTLQPASGGQPVCAPLRGVAQAGAPTGMSCLVSVPTPAQVQLRGPVLPPA